VDITGDVEDELGLRLRRRMARDQDYDLLVGEEAVKPDANESQGIVMDEHQAASQCHGRAQGSSAVDIMGRRCCEESGEKVGEFFICVDDDVADDAVPGAGPIRRTAKASTVNTRQTRSNRLSTR
jgi:hypothetical protein